MPRLQILLDVLGIPATVFSSLDKVQWVLVLCEWSFNRFSRFIRCSNDDPLGGFSGLFEGCRDFSVPPPPKSTGKQHT